MVKMRADFKVSDPDLTVYGCSSHYLNLLGCDITVKSVVNQVVEVNKYFRNRHRPNALLTACNGAVKPVLPCATRWNSQIDCLQSYITNRPFMIGIVSDENNDIEANIAKIILNIHLYKEVKSHVEQLSPIAKALDNAQSDSCGIADTCQDWVALCTNEQLEPVRSKVIKRFSQAMTEVHFLANLLHPHYLGHNLSPDQRRREWVFWSLEMQNLCHYYINSMLELSHSQQGSSLSSVSQWARLFGTNVLRARIQSLRNFA